MRYKIFGRRTGLRVSELALGAGNFGTRWGHGAKRAAAKKVFDSYVEAGGNFIDTADTYQFGESEELVGDFIASDRDYFVLAPSLRWERRQPMASRAPATAAKI
jgi:aryl-alcohol dehydrogenase-like predicted oxidoreductase